MARDPARRREKNIGSSIAAIQLRGPPARPGQTHPVPHLNFPVSSILNGEDSESPGRVVTLQEDSTGVLGVDNYSDKTRPIEETIMREAHRVAALEMSQYTWTDFFLEK